MAVKGLLLLYLDILSDLFYFIGFCIRFRAILQVSRWNWWQLVQIHYVAGCDEQ